MSFLHVQKLQVNGKLLAKKHKIKFARKYDMHIAMYCAMYKAATTNNNSLIVNYVCHTLQLTKSNIQNKSFDSSNAIPIIRVGAFMLIPVEES